MPNPNRLVSGSTNISCIMSITKNLRTLDPSRLTTVHAMRSLLSGSRPKKRKEKRIKHSINMNKHLN